MFTKWWINVNKSGGDNFFSHHLKIRNFSFVRISDFLFTTHGARRYSIKRTTSGIGFLGKSLLVDLIKRPLKKKVSEKIEIFFVPKNFFEEIFFPEFQNSFKIRVPYSINDFGKFWNSLLFSLPKVMESSANDNTRKTIAFVPKITRKKHILRSESWWNSLDSSPKSVIFQKISEISGA